MSDQASVTAEMLKLAHTLGVKPARLDALAGVPAEDLRTLRTQIADALFEADRPRFAKLAALSKAVPVALAVRMTELALPPLLTARTSEIIDPARGVEMVKRMSDKYLADVSASMDPSRAPELIGQLPPERVARAAAELARREQWIVIGGFVDHVSAAALIATVREFDGEQLLRIGFVLGDKDRLSDIAELVSDHQIDQILVAAETHELWTELDDLLAHLSRERAGRIRARFGLAPAALVSLMHAAVDSGALSKASLAKLTA